MAMIKQTSSDIIKEKFKKFEDNNILKERRDRERRLEFCEGYMYISTVGWICRRERKRREKGCEMK